VADTASGSFSLEGEDTTAFDTFTSGGFEVITLGTSLGSIKSLSSSGGDFNFIDTTTIHDNVATQIPGLASASSFSFENIWDVSDAGLLAMKVASDNKEQRAMKFVFADGQIMVFNGYVGATLLPGGSAQDLVTTSSVITMYGTPTYYAS
ncbi:MAG: phage tail protein, partial [Gammaproteobacteria bacterium]|nr:phage tail protein [Gammaproteobacteria bacterium]